jgi:preprotein translocase subunit SecA
VIGTRDYLMTLAEDLLDALVDTYAPREAEAEEWDLEALAREVTRVFAVGANTAEFADRTADEIRESLWKSIRGAYDEKEQLVGRDVLQRVERDIMLQIVDAQWKDHLYSLDHLKDGIGLRGYGQRDPLVEYKKESFAMFMAMKERVDEEIVRYLWWLRPILTEGADGGGTAGVPIPRRGAAARSSRSSQVLLSGPSSESAPAFGGARMPEPAFAGASRSGSASAQARALQPARVGGDDAEVKTVRRDMPKVGRNDPCPCGSGKKYKKCHGAAPGSA